MEIMILEKEEQKFEIPIAQNHKNAFEARHGKGSLTKLYKLLTKDCLTFGEIGEKLDGLSRERIRQIYEKRLAPYLPQKNGRERRHLCTLSRIRFLGKNNAYPPHVLAVWQEARKYAFVVQPVRSNYYALRKDLFINKKRCRVLEPYIAYKGKKRYANSHIGVEQERHVEYYIMVIKQEKCFFIIPSQNLQILSHYRNAKGYLVRHIQIPLDPSMYHWARKIDWLIYKNAWHFFVD